MDVIKASTLFEALSSGVRLELFRLLVRFAPDGLVAGEIARHLQIPATNLSFHLKGLLHTGLITVEKEGRFLRYRANIPLMLDTIAYLTEECCADHPERCSQYREQSSVASAVLPSCRCK